MGNIINTNGNLGLLKSQVTIGLLVDASGNSIVFPSGGSSIGNVTGPAVSTTNAIALYNDTTGQVLKNSAVIVNPSGTLNATRGLQISGTDIGSTFVYKAGDTMTGDLHFASGKAITMDGSPGGNSKWINDAIALTSISSVGAGVNIIDTNGAGGTVSVTAVNNSATLGGIITFDAKPVSGDGSTVLISGQTILLHKNISILNDTSGVNNLGSASAPFNTIFVKNISPAIAGSITTPASTTSNAISIWSGTAGAGLLDTSVLITGGNTVNASVISGTTVNSDTHNNKGTINSAILSGTTINNDILNGKTATFFGVISGTAISGTSLGLIGNPAPITSTGQIAITAGAGSSAVSITATSVNSSNTFGAPIFNAGTSVPTLAITAQQQGTSNFGVLTLSGTSIALNTTTNSNGTINAPTLSGTAVNSDTVNAKQYQTTLISGTASAATSAYTVNFNSGTSQKIVFSGVGAVTCAITLTGGLAGSTYLLETVNNLASGVQLSWANSPRILWPTQTSGTMTSGASAVDLFAFLYDGNTYLGNPNNNFL